MKQTEKKEEAVIGLSLRTLVRSHEDQQMLDIMKAQAANDGVIGAFARFLEDDYADFPGVTIHAPVKSRKTATITQVMKVLSGRFAGTYTFRASVRAVENDTLPVSRYVSYKTYYLPRGWFRSIQLIVDEVRQEAQTESFAAWLAQR